MIFLKQNNFSKLLVKQKLKNKILRGDQVSFVIRNLLAWDNKKQGLETNIKLDIRSCVYKKQKLQN